MSPPRALGDGHDLCVRDLSAVRAAIDRATRPIEMRARWRPRSTRGAAVAALRRGEGRHPHKRQDSMYVIKK